MPVSVSQHLKIKKSDFDATGAFDAILDIDTHLFIDPKLLRETDAPELEKSIEKVHKRFADVLKLLTASKEQEDRMWRAADKLMTFPEVQGICIGYSAKGTAGSGSGKEIRRRLLNSASEIIKVGIKEPEIFELAGLFEDMVGADRISDMVARIISDDLKAFTIRVLKELGVIKKIGASTLPKNPFNGLPIMLVPKDILRDLPMALDWSDTHKVASHNRKLREEVNELIGSTWRHAALQADKKDVKKVLLNNPEVLIDLLEQYLKRAAERYDFKKDPAGQIVWHEIAHSAQEMYPLKLSLPAKPTVDDVKSTVFLICKHFRDLIENHGLWRLLYYKKKRKHEEAVQLLFFGIADSYCEANNLDLSRESDGGRGPVDFKFSRGYKLRVVVEAKLTSNPSLIRGFKRQLPTYQIAEKAKRGIYLVIDNGGATEKRISAFDKLVRQARTNHLSVFRVDGRPKQSASRLR